MIDLRSRSALSFGLLISSAYCVSAPEIPESPAVACEEDSECPPGYGCRTSLARCVPNAALSDPPPEVVVGSAQVTPEVTRLDTPVVVTFRVTEALLDPPVVRLAAFPDRRFVGSETSSREFRYSYTPRGDEPEGTAQSLEADLLGASGAEATGIALG